MQTPKLSENRHLAHLLQGIAPPRPGLHLWFMVSQHSHESVAPWGGGVCAQSAHSTHSMHFTGRNWAILGQLALFLPTSVNLHCIGRIVGLAMHTVLRDASVDIR